MRLRLGLLRDTASNLEKEAALKRQQDAIKKLKEAENVFPANTATVRSDLPTATTPTPTTPTAEAKKVEPRIRPLSESKAIDAGANFISEAFLFSVAGSLILFESIRSKKKEAARRDTVSERLDLLEQRNRQDEERMGEMEAVEKELADRVFQLEEEVWKLRGGQGEFKGRPVKGREWVPTPLWEPKEQAKGFWRRVWTTGKEVEAEAEGRSEAEAAAAGAVA